MQLNNVPPPLFLPSRSQTHYFIRVPPSITPSPVITNYYMSASSTSSAIDKDNDEDEDVDHDVEDNYHHKDGDDEEDILQSPRNLRQPRFARLSTRCASELD